MREIADNGFTVLASEEVHLSQQRVQLLYEEHKDELYFENLTTYMNGTVLVMILGKPGALQAWNYLIGPKDVQAEAASKPNSLRARYGTDELRNGFHGSSDPVSARKEIDLYFPQISVQKIPTLMEVEDLLNKKPAPRPHVEPKKSLNDVLVDGLTQLCRIKPVGTEAVVWLAEWLLRNNPNKPSVATVEFPDEQMDVRGELEKSTEGEKIEILWAVGGKRGEIYTFFLFEGGERCRNLLWSCLRLVFTLQKQKQKAKPINQSINQSINQRQLAF